jgi:hypothetical protein
MHGTIGQPNPYNSRVKLCGVIESAKGETPAELVASIAPDLVIVANEGTLLDKERLNGVETVLLFLLQWARQSNEGEAPGKIVKHFSTDLLKVASDPAISEDVRLAEVERILHSVLERART